MSMMEISILQQTARTENINMKSVIEMYPVSVYSMNVVNSIWII